jgi:hypothetical protein
MPEDTNRADPLSDLADLEPGVKVPPVAPDTIRDVSELAGLLLAGGGRDGTRSSI